MEPTNITEYESLVSLVDTLKQDNEYLLIITLTFDKVIYGLEYFLRKCFS